MAADVLPASREFVEPFRLVRSINPFPTKFEAEANPCKGRTKRGEAGLWPETPDLVEEESTHSLDATAFAEVLFRFIYKLGAAHYSGTHAFCFY